MTDDSEPTIRYRTRMTCEQAEQLADALKAIAAAPDSPPSVSLHDVIREVFGDDLDQVLYVADPDDAEPPWRKPIIMPDGSKF